MLREDVLVSAVWHESAICTHRAPLSGGSLQPLEVLTEPRAELPVLCGSVPLAARLHVVVYTRQTSLISQFVLPFPQPWCPQVPSQEQPLCSCPSGEGDHAGWGCRLFGNNPSSGPLPSRSWRNLRGSGSGRGAHTGSPWISSRQEDLQPASPTPRR